MGRAWLAGTAGVGAALIGSLCCIGPLAFVVFGVGAGLASTFDPLRPLFGGVMLGSFALGFYAAYGRAGGTAEAGDSPAACATRRSRSRDRVVLWASAVLALVIWTFPSWSIWLV